MGNISATQIGNLHQKITIILTEQDYKIPFQNALKKVAKDIKMPGFRPGHTPVGMIEKMHGKSIFLDEISRLNNEKIQGYLTENKIDILYQPFITKIDFSNKEQLIGGEAIAEFEIGLKPEINLELLKNINIDKYHITVSDKAVEDQIKYYQEQFAEHKDIDKIEHKDSDYLNGYVYAEGADTSDEQKLTPKFILLKDITDDAFDKYKNVQKDSVIEFNDSDIKAEAKDTYKDFTIEDKKTLIKVISIKTRVLLEVGEKLFNLTFKDANFKTEEEFKNKIIAETEKFYQSQSKNHSLHILQHELPKYLNYELPELFLKTFIESKQEQKEKNLDEKELKELYEYVKFEILKTKISDIHHIKTTTADVENQIKNDILSKYGQYIQSMSQLEGIAKKMVQDKNHFEQTYNNIVTSKIFTQLFDNYITLIEKNVSDEEFGELVKKHNEAHHKHEHTDEHNH